MAVTKIHAIKFTVGKAIEYICNENKTDEKVLISSFACAPETADIEFKFALSNARDQGNNKAFHLIQSFAPGETTGEEAHQMGKELADRLLEGKYSYVLATHVDKHHVHNHIILCAVNNIDYKKYHDCTKEHYHIRNVSDRICMEHGKSVITEFGKGDKTYSEWMHTRKGDSWKAQIKKDIDECIKAALTYEDFLRRMKEKGYEINGADFGEGSAKYISFRPLGKDRFVRGRSNSLGANYTKEKIKERIEQKAAIGSDTIERKTDKPTLSIQEYLKKYASKKPITMIDKTNEKIAGSIPLSRWADKENLKRAGEIFAELGRLGLQSEEALHNKISELHEQARSEKLTVKKLEKELHTFQEILNYGRQYHETKKYNTNYENSKDQDRYYRIHSYELSLYWSSVEHLQNLGVDIATMRLKDIEDHITKISADREQLIASFKSKEQEYDKLRQMDKSLTTYLNEPTHKTSDKTHTQNHIL